MIEILEIIKTIETSNVNVNPTQIYNEGWMTRLLVYYSIKEKIYLKEIDFSLIKNWTSEGLLSSPFVKANIYREGYTHADIVLGDFIVNYEDGGLINVLPEAKYFGVIEAKMKSPLSKGTSNALDYNQASRNVTCIANNTNLDCTTFFYVVRPKPKLYVKGRVPKCLSVNVNNVKINEEIRGRFLHHNSKNESIDNENDIIKKADKCIVGIITYEEWIELFKNDDIREILEKFYKNCIKWNKL